MAIEITTYLTSDGKNFQSEEAAAEYQSVLNTKNGRLAAEKYFDIMIDYFASQGNSKMWSYLKLLRDSNIRRIKIQRSNLSEIMTTLIKEDLKGLFILASNIADHEFELPKELGKLDGEGAKMAAVNIEYAKRMQNEQLNNNLS